MNGIKRLQMLFVLTVGSAVAAPTNDGMYATLQTTMGDVCFELYYTNVPQTVASFVSLAEGSRPWIDPRSTFISEEPYYNGIIFHRVITNFMIQGGSPQGTGTDGPGYIIRDEFDPTLRHDRPGVVSMANYGPDSNGGQFFITVVPYPVGNDHYSVFGSVVEGMTVVSNIAATAVDTLYRPLEDITITNAFITRNGAEAQNFSVTNWSLPEVEALPVSIASGDGIELSTGTATSSYQYVYSSTNLVDWTEDNSDYWTVPNGNWELTPPGESRGFFHANRVVYNTVNTNMPASPAGHHLVMTMDGGSVIQITLATNDAGTFKLNNYPNDNIIHWEWNQENPYGMTLLVDTDFPERYVLFLYYSTPTNGRCDGIYYFNGVGQALRGGAFTDQDLN